MGGSFGNGAFGSTWYQRSALMSIYSARRKKRREQAVNPSIYECNESGTQIQSLFALRMYPNSFAVTYQWIESGDFCGGFPAAITLTSELPTALARKYPTAAAE
jgi:hypothetical protein